MSFITVLNINDRIINPGKMNISIYSKKSYFSYHHLGVFLANNEGRTIRLDRKLHHKPAWKILAK